MIVALHSVLKPGAESEYDREHQRIPDDLAAGFARVGIREWSIWRSGSNLFHLVECDDWTEAVEKLTDDPANLAWQAQIGRHVVGFIGEDDGPTGQMLPLVYSLRAQQGSC